MIYTIIGLFLAVLLVIKIKVLKKENYFLDWFGFIIGYTFVFSGKELHIEAFIAALFFASILKFGDFGNYINKILNKKEKEKNTKENT